MGLLPVIAGAILITMLSLAATLGWQLLRAPSATAGAPPILIVVRSGASTAEVAELLYRKRLVRSPLALRLYARVSGAAAELRPGRYLLRQGMTPPQLLAELRRGQPTSNSFTIPEGSSLEEIAQVLVRRGFISQASAFVAAADGSPVGAEFRPPGVALRHHLEGYLFPDTYRVDPDITPARLVAMLEARLEQAWTPAYRARTAAHALTLHQVLTLASIVEAEARLDAERPIIAAVYLGRLRIGMKLDADPTVRYVVGKPHGTGLATADLRVESAYNTYLHPGLPPGPINSPGEASIRAVLYPANVPYLYFVARRDGSGAHVFSRTLAEHHRAVAAQQG